MKRIIKKIINFILTFLLAIGAFLASLAVILAWPFLIWRPHKNEKEVTFLDSFFNPYLLRKKFGSRIYIVIMVILILIIGLALFFTYVK